MKKSIQSALNNLKSHPASYTIIALVIALTVGVVPQLPSEHRLIAFITAVIIVVIAVSYLHTRDSYRRIRECQDTIEKKRRWFVNFKHRLMENIR